MLLNNFIDKALSLNKVAIFVEGLTEELFVVQLITELAQNNGLQIEVAKQWRGKVSLSASKKPNSSTTLYVLVVNCANDEQVKTQINLQYQSLRSAGYTAILGLRDVYPFTSQDIPKITQHLQTSLPTTAPQPTMHLAVMEVEAWFIDEHTHFPRISYELDVGNIAAHGFDIGNTPAEDWTHPADTLDKIYKIANARYMSNKGEKTKRRIERTVNAISYTDLYITSRSRNKNLSDFLAALERALF